MVSPSLQNPFYLASRLIAAGAILTLPGVPLIRRLVVDAQWSGERDVTVLTCGEDLCIRSANIHFDRLGVHSFGVALEQGDGVLAVLTSIDKAAVPNPQEFHRLFQRWRERGAPVSATRPDRAAAGGLPLGKTRAPGLPLAASL